MGDIDKINQRSKDFDRKDAERVKKRAELAALRARLEAAEARCRELEKANEQMKVVDMPLWDRITKLEAENERLKAYRDNYPPDFIEGLQQKIDELTVENNRRIIQSDEPLPDHFKPEHNEPSEEIKEMSKEIRELVLHPGRIKRLRRLANAQSDYAMLDNFDSFSKEETEARLHEQEAAEADCEKHGDLEER